MDWKEIVRKVAPAIGTAAGGPWAGMATKFLAEKFLGNPEATPDEIGEAIATASPEKLLQLRSLDNDFKLELKKLGIRENELEVEDRKSARELFRVNIWPQIGLSSLFILGYFLILALMLTGKVIVDEPMKALLYILIGVLTGEVPRIMSFWFGSSMGSKEKTVKLGADLK